MSSASRSVHCLGGTPLARHRFHRDKEDATERSALSELTAGRRTGRSIGRSIVRPIDRSIDRSVDRSIELYAARSIDRSIDRGGAVRYHREGRGRVDDEEQDRADERRPAAAERVEVEHERDDHVAHVRAAAHEVPIME